ncbi:MAG TPA: hypothetical protein VMV69_24795 [Pirellulales bacterium]|nr:hypothetical protein [Pirellulales bacterium]
MYAVRRVFAHALFISLALSVPALCQAKGIRRRSDLNSHPHSVRYDPLKDQIIRQESVVTKQLGNPPGGKVSYSGSRLRQFRFIGKPGRGGIYDAFKEYHNRIGTDPMNYKRRLR